MSPHRRETLASLADALIPAVEGMPSAAKAGVSQGGLDRVLAALPELSAPLEALLDEARERDPELVIAELRRGPAFGALAVAVAGAYLTEPEVVALLGYGGRAAIPVVDDIDDEVVGLLESVLARGATWRKI